MVDLTDRWAFCEETKAPPLYLILTPTKLAWVQLYHYGCCWRKASNLWIRNKQVMSQRLHPYITQSVIVCWDLKLNEWASKTWEQFLNYESCPNLMTHKRLWTWVIKDPNALIRCEPSPCKPEVRLQVISQTSHEVLPVCNFYEASCDL